MWNYRYLRAKICFVTSQTELTVNWQTEKFYWKMAARTLFYSFDLFVKLLKIKCINQTPHVSQHTALSHTSKFFAHMCNKKLYSLILKHQTLCCLENCSKFIVARLFVNYNGDANLFVKDSTQNFFIIIVHNSERTCSCEWLEISISVAQMWTIAIDYVADSITNLNSKTMHC